MSVRRVPLGELCEMDRQGIQTGDPLTVELPFVGVENVVGGTGIASCLGVASRRGTRSQAYYGKGPILTNPYGG